jgi:hypothetical protein
VNQGAITALNEEHFAILDRPTFVVMALDVVCASHYAIPLVCASVPMIAL